MKHTPGPWKVDEATDLPPAVIEDTEMGYGIAELGPRSERNIANARLIAAAPALLEELEAARDVIADAMDNHIYNEADGEEPGPDCQYAAALTRIDALILTAKGRA